MKRTLLSVFLIGGLALAAAPSLAEQKVDETRPAPADGLVTVENLLGSVRVIGWAKNEVQVTGTLGDGVETLEISSSGERTRIRVEHPERLGKISWNRGEGEADLEIHVPAGSDIEVEGVNLEIQVSGIRGEIDLESVNGSIRAEGAPREIRATTVNGTVSLEAAGKIEAEAVNGNIRVSGGGGELSAAVVNGEIEVTGGSFDEAECSSVSGDLLWSAGLGKRARLSLESHSGSVILRLPKRIDAEFDISTFSGKIENELGPAAERTDEYAPGYELQFTLGDGSAKIDISSFSGRVEIREAR